MPILYCHHESGHCYKIALALTLLGVAFEQRPVDLNRLRELRRADFREVARFDEVPVLVFDDGLAVCQSNTILTTLASRYGRLDGRTEEERVRVREWLAWEGNRIGMSLALVRFWRHFTPTEPDVEAWMAERLSRDLDRLNLALLSADFLVGDALTIADIGCCGYLFWAHQAKIELDAWPAVAAWLDRIRAQPGWRAPYDLIEARYPILTGTRT
ncbi:MAG TPA: glutathione S-transferase family protein [Rudaea sp.]|nr:glutathione S-transferase family protein [Rudaea sp.]